jgi:4-amino-4-deoxy-L-arabinose transferase-like glycosyltransferase
LRSSNRECVDDGVSTPPETQSGPATNAPLAVTSPAPPVGVWRPLRIGEWRLLALIVLLCILRDLPWRLEESGQAEHAFTSLEMVRAGHWWFQHLPGSVLATVEPPLAGWCSAAFYYLSGGDWDLAWRLPSLFAGLAMLAVLWLAGERVWPRWGGTLAAGAFALNFLTPRIAMLAGPEMLLALETTLLGLVVWSQVRENRPWSAGARWQVFWLLLAALMTAGPIVYALLWPGMIVHRWISRRGSARPIPDAWGGWWHWTLPMLPFLFWLERGAVAMPGFYQQIIGQHLPGNMVLPTATGAERQPFYFYAGQLLIGWLPWSALFLAVRLRAWRVWWRLCAEPGTLWLICWTAGALGCLSLFPAKPLDRLFPVVPPLCLLLTALLAAARSASSAPSVAGEMAAEAGWPQNWSRWTLWLACAATVVVSAAEVSLVYRQRANDGADFAARVLALTGPERCELVLTGKPTALDAAMLVYLRRLTYIDPPEAIQLQSTGELDRIVLDDPSARGARGLLTRFNGAQPLLVCGGGAKFVLLAGDVPAPAAPPHQVRRKSP